MFVVILMQKICAICDVAVIYLNKRLQNYAYFFNYARKWCIILNTIVHSIKLKKLLKGGLRRSRIQNPLQALTLTLFLRLSPMVQFQQLTHTPDRQSQQIRTTTRVDTL